ncbi:pentatricopeptide repeat-containing protein At3g09040, mitochondrial-like [Malania oleifera]|uniref:pentatricopeptide repeat-containing protein At3g09040, mitochondrial-like n=1 Tax=Malania oleifera TaxID=397392 RepID=UPI0025AE7F62|nr:pentatricopeptide repeat-containing protein At3g09040, mitochondrial-like [Malania oleifera]
MNSVVFLPLKRFMLFANKSFIFSERQHEFYNYKLCSPYTILSLVNDSIALSAALSLSANSKSYILGTQIHAQVIKLGFSKCILTQNNLINMYMKYRILGNGLKVFDEMFERNLVSWTLLINGAIQIGEFEFGLKVYVDMTRAGLKPNQFALGSVTKACIAMSAKEFGLSIHCVALKIGMEKNQFVGSSILHMYAKSGNIEAAEWVFGHVDNLDIGCWNAMVGGYAECGLGFEAVKVVSFIRSIGVTMDNFTFINALKGCLVLDNLDFGREIHGLMIRSDVELSVSVMNSLMNMYFKNGGKDSALKVFNLMQGKDITSWNILFSSFSQEHDSSKVASLFCRLLLTRLRPNHITFSTLFRLCGEALDLDLGLQFYCLALQLGFSDEANVVSSIINMLTRCEEVKMARVVFDNAFKNVITWNEMILGYSSNCCHMEALKLFHNLWELEVEADETTFSIILRDCSMSENQLASRQIHGIIVKTGFANNKFVCSSLIKGYIRFGLLDDSFEFLIGLERLDSSSWGTMFSELVRQGCNDETIKLMNYLIEVGEKLDEFILGSILNGCAASAVYHRTKTVHSFVIKLGFEMHSFVASAVIDAYAKCGDIDGARMVFEQLSKSEDVVLLNTMIMAYAHHGLIIEAMEIFDKIKSSNLQPSQATFVSVMSACNNSGHVDEGRNIFKSISLNYGMQPSPDNYGCLVDMLSRNGFLEDAKRIILDMPFSPWPAIWRSLLNGCRIHGNQELGEWTADKLVQLAPKSDSAYVLLSKIYSEDGSWENAAKVWKGMVERGFQKDPGYSSIEI